MLEHWLSLTRHTPLAILTDFDGTLVPFAATPEDARPDDELHALLRSLAALPGLRVVIVSGRPHTVLERYFPDSAVWLVAEHGAWSRSDGAWKPTLELDATPIQELAGQLEAIAARYPGARVERKSWSCALHDRLVSSFSRSALGIEATVALGDFLAQHHSFERLDGVNVVEVCAAAARKSFAVEWARQQTGPDSRIIAIGDDLTDEHLFAALGPLDEPILVQGGLGRRSHARWVLDDVDAVRRFLGFVRAVREGERPPELPVAPIQPTPRPSSLEATTLLVVSNRLPDLRSAETVTQVGRANVGGLVSALEPILAARKGLWLGWGGQVVPDDQEPGHGVFDGRPRLAWFDYKESWQRAYYDGFCNATLWPLFHSFPERVVIDKDTWDSYVTVHDVFADEAQRYIGADDTLWVHDYHLLLFARRMRQRGHRGPIGLFLHVPFPCVDLCSILPWAGEIVDGMLDFDLIGFHTPSYLANFAGCAGALLGSLVAPTVIEHRGKRTNLGVFPIGIFPESFQESPGPELAAEIESITQSLGSAKLVLGVDRLDYTKGIPERLRAFGRLLELFPEWRGKVSLIQISVPSRADVAEYRDQRTNIEGIVGRVNGQFGEANWVPIRYLYRSYSREHLSQLYRAAHVGYVTPLRDGMNLVAKEYVAAQDPSDPGALLLSQFAGAAVEMSDAVLTNPYYTDGMARDLDRALRMSLEERKARHARLLAVVERTDARSWATAFLESLASSGAMRTT